MNKCEFKFYNTRSDHSDNLKLTQTFFIVVVIIIIMFGKIN